MLSICVFKSLLAIICYIVLFKAQSFSIVSLMCRETPVGKNYLVFARTSQRPSTDDMVQAAVRK